ncbi:MAG: hypothetical protein K6C14_08695 [Eubacterium sp.]|nr:hypothetical protein [Eubacterium sp.]
MKKALLIFLSLVLTVTVLASCSAKQNKTEDMSGDPKNTSAASSWEETVLTTDSAMITEGEAINLIKSYSANELSLTKEEKKQCQFMCYKSGVKIKDDYYINVNANIVKESGKNEKGEPVYTFDTKGEYYIRYDGKQILKKVKNDYVEMKLKEIKEDTTE